MSMLEDQLRDMGFDLDAAVEELNSSDDPVEDIQAKIQDLMQQLEKAMGLDGSPPDLEYIRRIAGDVHSTIQPVRDYLRDHKKALDSVTEATGIFLGANPSIPKKMATEFVLTIIAITMMSMNEEA